jgi:hypothetical protein
MTKIIRLDPLRSAPPEANNSVALDNLRQPWPKAQGARRRAAGAATGLARGTQAGPPYQA